MGLTTKKLTERAHKVQYSAVTMTSNQPNAPHNVSYFISKKLPTGIPATPHQKRTCHRTVRRLKSRLLVNESKSHTAVDFSVIFHVQFGVELFDVDDGLVQFHIVHLLEFACSLLH